MSFNLKIDCPLLPTAPDNLYIENGSLVSGGWKNFFLRSFVPKVASAQDVKLRDYFSRYFADFLAQQETTQGLEKARSMLPLAEQLIARSRGGFFSRGLDISRLEHYTLTARERLKSFDPQYGREQLMEKCRLDNRPLLAHWKSLGFPEEAFWSCPDLVDFVSKSHLHRFIRHADYRHTIEMALNITRHGGQVCAVLEPHLLMNGRMTPWSTISSTLAIDDEGRFFSKGVEGEKLYWIYHEQGFIQKDRHDFDKLLHFKTLPQAPRSCQVQIVTSHYPRKKWQLWHHLVKGNIHTHIRVIPRAGFSTAHSRSELQDGKVYSIGYGARWADVAQGQPLKTIPGLFYNPDSTEFFKEDLLVTTIDSVTDEQLLKVIELTKKRSKELRPFNIITHNCCTEVTAILKEAGVVDLKNEMRADEFLYKTFVPKWARRGIAAIERKLSPIVPEKVSKALSYIGFLPVAMILSPLLLVLGAWRVKRPDLDDKRQGDLTPMMATIADVFDVKKFTVNMTMNVSKWQKKQSNTVYIEQ